MKNFIVACLFTLVAPLTYSQKMVETDILIIGGGASGTMAGIQAARMGSNVIIVEKTTWLGGMLTSAGVSAIDGNHRMPSGLWGEFRQYLYGYYGGPKEVSTGWVSNTLFEPSVGNTILQTMAAKEKMLSIWFETTWGGINKVEDGWIVEVIKDKRRRKIKASLLIDATELGDVAAAVNVSYDVGIESKEQTGEALAPDEPINIIQDLTYVVTLQDYVDGKDHTISKPTNYDPSEFHCACDMDDPKGTTEPGSSCYQMLQYGRLPGNKYMINWPRCGNDTYLDLINLSDEDREEALKEAKLTSLRFVYYIQNELGFTNLGIAVDEYPTTDDLPLLPYHRESRRIKGEVRLTIDYLSQPFDQEFPLYRTGIAVGDYPVDHHHLENDQAPDVDFIAFRIPSFNIPLGTLIPRSTDDIIVAEKSISVSHIANGSTRLQPVVIELGQAAGTLAALAIAKNLEPRKIPVREVQQALLDSDAYLMPYIDVSPDHPWFEEIQRVGATGIMRGTGIPYKWANQTWFYPDREWSEFDFIQGMKTYYPQLQMDGSGVKLNKEFFLQVIHTLMPSQSIEELANAWPPDIHEADGISRGEAAVLIDRLLSPFQREIDFYGNLLDVKGQTIH